MNARVPWLFVLVFCVAGSNAGAETAIRVIQPGTNKLLAHAQVSVLTARTPGLRVEQGQTGLSGEPFAPAADRLDPVHEELVVKAKKRDVHGTVLISHDPDKYFWKQAYEGDRVAEPAAISPLGLAQDAAAYVGFADETLTAYLAPRRWRPAHDLGDWRPDIVYEYNKHEDEEQKDWEPRAYAQWKAAVVADELERIEGDLGLKPSFLNVVLDELTDALKRGPIGDVQKAADDATLEELIADAKSTRVYSVLNELTGADLKRPIDPELIERVEQALSEVPDPTLGDYIEDELKALISSVRKDAPEPPVIRVMVQKPYRVPARTYRQRLCATRQPAN